MIVAAVLSVLSVLAWVNQIPQKSRHYAAQAAIQAKLEAISRDEEARFKEEPGVDLAVLGPDESQQHAELRRRYERLATHPWETPPADLPMPFPWDRDRRVIEAALDDLMDPENPEKGIEYPANSGSGAEVVLGEITYCPYLSDDRKTDGEGPDRRVEDEANADLTRRNGGGGLPLTELGPGWRRPIRFDDLVLLYEKSIESTEGYWDFLHQCHPNACAWLDVSLPGYSRDGRTAIVIFARIYVHATFWTYILHKTGTGWVVSRRERDFTE